jgi:hypothetical protein
MKLALVLHSPALAQVLHSGSLSVHMPGSGGGGSTRPNVSAAAGRATAALALFLAVLPAYGPSAAGNQTTSGWSAMPWQACCIMLLGAPTHALHKDAPTSSCTGD